MTAIAIATATPSSAANDGFPPDVSKYTTGPEQTLAKMVIAAAQLLRSCLLGRSAALRRSPDKLVA